LEDPVLVSYSKCISAGEVLVAWTRTETGEKEGPVRRLAKELWLFWYSSIEPGVHDFISKDLHQVEEGSYENGLSYESRTLLFKAFHNLIERNLLTKGFARFGRWFTQPQVLQSSQSSFPSASKKEPMNRSCCESSSKNQLSFAFDFFVHGDSSICVSVDVRVHDEVFRIHGSLESGWSAAATTWPRGPCHAVSLRTVWSFNRDFSQGI